MSEPSLESIKDWGKGMWTVFDRMAQSPRSPAGETLERRVERLDAEAEIIDLFRRYHSFYDAGNVDGVMSLFADDCVVVNERGTYIGATAIRENYEYLCGRRRFIVHYGTNPFVRFEADEFSTAWLGAFWYAIVFTDSAGADACGGTYVDRMRREDGSWQIFEQRITTNFRSELSPKAAAFGKPATPSDEFSSKLLIDPQHVL
jgi:hypothetical protein